MNLSTPPAGYDKADQTRMRSEVKKADDQNHKKGRDIEVGQGRLIFTDTVTGERIALERVNGVAVWTPL